jgi:hypothetical protein
VEARFWCSFRAQKTDSRADDRSQVAGQFMSRSDVALRRMLRRVHAVVGDMALSSEYGRGWTLMPGV